MSDNLMWKKKTDIKQTDSCKSTYARGVQEAQHQVNGALAVADTDASKSITVLSNTFQVSTQRPDPYKPDYRQRNPNRCRHQSWLLTWQCDIQYCEDNSDNTQARAHVSTICETQKAEWISRLRQARALCMLVSAAGASTCSIGNCPGTLVTCVTSPGVTSADNSIDVIYIAIVKSVWMLFLPL